MAKLSGLILVVVGRLTWLAGVEQGAGAVVVAVAERGPGSAAGGQSLAELGC